MGRNLQYDENNLEYYDKRQIKGKKPKINRGKGLLFVVVLMVAVFAVLMSPIFTVKKIEISNTLRKFSASEICEITKINEGVNLFSINKRLALKKLKESPYIEKAEIRKEYPDTVYIDIEERRVRGYVPYMGSYLYIDEYGRILDISGSFTEALPIVKGLEFDSFCLGEKIEAKNEKAFDIVVVISQIMTKYEMLDTVVEVDVSDTENIKACVNKVNVNLGTISNCDEKIRTMTKIVSQIPKEDRGSLDLSDLSKPLVFKYLT